MCEHRHDVHPIELDESQLLHELLLGHCLHGHWHAVRRASVDEQVSWMHLGVSWR